MLSIRRCYEIATVTAAMELDTTDGERPIQGAQRTEDRLALLACRNSTGIARLAALIGSPCRLHALR